MAPETPVEQIAELLQVQGRTLAVAESLTGGLLASRLAAASNASSWLRGGIVAYSSEVKFHLLGVPPGPVVSQEAAAAMATAVATLLEADTSVAVTGVAGPSEQDGQPPGTVWLALNLGGQVDTTLLDVEGDSPAAICHGTCDQALRLLANGLSRREGSFRP